MPDNALYPVKLATERAQLAITPSNIGKTELNAKFADRRADEITYMANKGDAQEVQKAAQRLNTNLENMTNLAKNSSQDNKRGTDATFNTNVPAATNGSNTNDGNMPQPIMGVAPLSTPSTNEFCCSSVSNSYASRSQISSAKFLERLLPNRLVLRPRPNPVRRLPISYPIIIPESHKTTKQKSTSKKN